MDLLFSFGVWILLLIFAYYFCTSLQEYSEEGGPFLPAGRFFARLENVVYYCSIGGLLWLTASIVWMIWLCYHTGAIVRIFAG